MGICLYGCNLCNYLLSAWNGLLGRVEEINNKKVKEGRGYTLQIFISTKKGAMVMMKKSTKIIGSLLTCGALFLGGIHVQAMEGTSGNVKYYGYIKNSYTTVDAGITAKTVCYPTAQATVYYRNGQNRQTGTSYATYSFVQANTPGKNYPITSNKIHFTASSFDLWTAAD